MTSFTGLTMLGCLLAGPAHASGEPGPGAAALAGPASPVGPAAKQGAGRQGKKKKRSKKKKRPTDAPFQGQKVQVTGAAMGTYASMRESAWVLPPDAGPGDEEWEACEKDPDCNITDSENNAANGFGWALRTGIWRANAFGLPGVNLGLLYDRSQTALKGQNRVVPVDTDSTSIVQEYVGDRADYDVVLHHIALGVMGQYWFSRRARIYGQGRLAVGGGWAAIETERKTRPNQSASGTMGGFGLTLDAGVGMRIGKHVGLTFLVPLLSFELVLTKPKTHPTNYLPFIDEDVATNWRNPMGLELAAAF